MADAKERAGRKRSCQSIAWRCLAALLLAAPAGADDQLVQQIDNWLELSRQVTPDANGSLICEAEEFRGEGWTPRRWGGNYYCATFANAFLSRQAYLAWGTALTRALLRPSVEP